jgi:Leucine-rich repeat (LRR) protein
MINLLKKNMTLHSITIEEAGITDEGALSLSIGLQANAVLSSVSLPRNQLSTFGLENLIDCLDVNSNLTDLDLTENLITDLPASLFSYLRMSTCPLQLLNLSYNPLSPASVTQLLNTLQQAANTTSL